MTFKNPKTRFIQASLLASFSLFAVTACAGSLGDVFKAIGDQVLNNPDASAAILGTVNQSDMVQGVKDALAQGVERSVSSLGKSDGFWADKAVQIPLPPIAQKIETGLRAFGKGAVVDEFHLTLNRAAEKAMPSVGAVLGDAIREMSIQDAVGIVRGEPNSATNYFKKVADPRLQAAIKPLVAKTMAEVGVTQQWSQVQKTVGPLLNLLYPKAAQFDLDTYVTETALTGLYTKIAEEETNIRANPAARGTELLKKVFGAKP